MTITFSVPGHPTALARHRRVKTKDGRMFNHPDPKSAQYLALIRQFAQQAMNGRPQITGAVILTTAFYFNRPNSHFGTGRNAGNLKLLYINARPTGRSDLDNLVKGISDGCNGIVYRDDSQIVEYGYRTGKYYINDRHPSEGAEVTVTELD